jgi:hypothetical protein
MNWEAIGAVGEVVGASAVFISLLYLAIQIRASRRSDQIVAAAEADSAVRDWIGQIVCDEKLYDLYRRGLTDYESLSRSEKGRYSLLLFQLFRSGERGWVQRQMGLEDAGIWAGVEATIKFVFRTQGGTRFLAKNSHFFRPEFCTAVQKMLTEAESTENIGHDTNAGNKKSVDSSIQTS